MTRTQPARTLHRVLVGIGLFVAAYLVIRGVAEPFVIDLTDPASYRSDWGGPSLIGVLAVHTGPAVVALAASTGWLLRRHRRHAQESSRARRRSP